MLPFWASIATLSVVQAVTVVLPSPRAILALDDQKQLGRLAGRWWALVPPGSVLLFVLVGGAAATASAQFLTYLALWAVPVGAALALGWLGRWSRPAVALAVLPLMALAWADRNGLAGQGAAVALTALSCVALGALFAAFTPARWLMVGIVAMALVDVALVASELLQRPNEALNVAHPVADLPRLQAELFGSAAMGYGDLFVAALLGGVLAATGGAARQWRVGALVAVLALGFDLLFFFVHELPATVPVAFALVVLLVSERTSARPRVTGVGARG
jgi:hypothetical protein